MGGEEEKTAATIASQHAGNIVAVRSHLYSGEPGCLVTPLPMDIIRGSPIETIPELWNYGTSLDQHRIDFKIETM